MPLYSFIPDPVTGKRDTISDADLSDHIIRAAASVELESGLTIFPVQIDEKQPFDTNWWQNYGYLQVQRRPVASVEKVAFTPATQADILIISPDWIEAANFSKGQINVIPLVPAVSTNMVAATTGSSGGAAFLTIFYGKGWMPALVRVTYTAGFINRQFPRVVNELIGVQAAIDILDMLAATNRATSYSLGIDSMNQSVATPGPMIYQFRLEQLTAKKADLMNKLRNYYRNENIFFIRLRGFYVKRSRKGLERQIPRSGLGYRRGQFQPRSFRAGHVSHGSSCSAT